jgi:hypothetical protein
MQCPMLTCTKFFVYRKISTKNFLKTSWNMEKNKK